MAARDRSRSPHGGADDEVFGLIVQREQARQAKDFGTADHLRERLTQLGVTLFDKTNQWRTADGRSGRIPSFNEIEGGVTGDSLAMMQSGGMGGMVGGVSGYESSDRRSRTSSSSSSCGSRRAPRRTSRSLTGSVTS